MSVTPPAQRIWWKEPIERVELVWIVLAFIWGLTMFATMIVWHVVGKQNLSNEAYRIRPARDEFFGYLRRRGERARDGAPGSAELPASIMIHLLCDCT